MKSSSALKTCVLAILCVGAWGLAVADEPPQPKPPKGYKQIVLRTLEYGGPGGLAVSRGRGEGELPAGPAVIFLDSQERIYAYDPVEGKLKRFSREREFGKPSEEIEGVVDCGPQVLRVDRKGCIYVYCGDWAGSWRHPEMGVDERDLVNLKKCDPSGKVIYEIGLWDNEADEYALVIYKGGRKKGEPRAIDIEQIVPEGLDPQSVYPKTGVGTSAGPYHVDSHGNFYWPLMWLTISSGYEEIAGQGVVKVSSTGDVVSTVPSSLVDGKRRYFVVPSPETPDVRLDSGLYERRFEMFDEKGTPVGARAVQLPADSWPTSEHERRGGACGTWQIDDSGWLYCVEPVRLDSLPELKSGISLRGQYLLHILDEQGQLVGTGRGIRWPRFDYHFEPTVGRDGNIYFLHFRDRDIQVIKWEKVSD